jgi:uridine phosphorylase
MYIVVFVNSAQTRFNQRRIYRYLKHVDGVCRYGQVFAREYVVSVAFNRQHVIVVDHGLPEPSTSFFLTKLLHLAVPTFVTTGKII